MTDLNYGAPGFNYGAPGFDYNQLYNPSPYPSVAAAPGIPTAAPAPGTEVVVTGSNPTTFNIFKIVIIILLLILIGVTIALALVFRSNTKAAESNENPLCPIIACPVNPSNPSFPTCSTDPTCGSSAFRINSAGQKICSSNRYAPT
jgi:hypothetical protein